MEKRLSLKSRSFALPYQTTKEFIFAEAESKEAIITVQVRLIQPKNYQIKRIKQ